MKSFIQIARPLALIAALAPAFAAHAEVQSSEKTIDVELYIPAPPKLVAEHQGTAMMTSAAEGVTVNFKANGPGEMRLRASKIAAMTNEAGDTADLTVTAKLDSYQLVTLSNESLSVGSKISGKLNVQQRMYEASIREQNIAVTIKPTDENIGPGKWNGHVTLTLESGYSDINV